MLRYLLIKKFITMSPHIKRMTLIASTILVGVFVATLALQNKSKLIETPVVQASTAGLSYQGQPREATGNPRFGYNGFFVEGFLKNNNRNIKANVEALDQVLTDTRATWLRFPGGTRANDYVFNLANPGFGRDTAYDRGFKNNLIVEYADIAKAVHAKTAYVVDFAAHFPTYYGGTAFMPAPLRNKTDDQIIKMNLDGIEYLINQGLDVPVIELGNELNGADLSPWRNISVANKSYADTERIMKPELDRYENLVGQYRVALNDLAARKSAELGRTITFEIGVPIFLVNGPNGKMFNGPLGARNTYWNTRVAQMPIDAMIVHTYSNFGSCNTFWNNTAFVNCLKQKSNEDVASLPNNIDRTKALSPSKKLWITEYNAGFGFSADPRMDRSGFSNSPAHIQYLRDVTNIFKQKEVDLYLLHMLYTSQGTSYVIVNNLPSTTTTRVTPTSDLYAQPSICAFISETSPAFQKYKCVSTGPAK